MRTVPITLEYIEGQLLIRYANAGRWPEKIGKALFDMPVRMMLDDQVTAFRRALRLASPMMVTTKKVCFGESSNWTTTDDGKTWNMVDPYQQLTVAFDEDAINGAKAALRLMIDPSSPIPADIVEMDELVWKVAAKFGHFDDLRKEMGLPARPNPYLAKA